LYESITTEGWLDVMYKGIDSVDIGKQPKLNNNMMLSLYFISFIIIGNIFILNLFVGIVIDKFNRLKDRMCGYALMTRDQKEWVETEKQMIRLELEQKKSLPVNDNELIAYHVSNHRYFENFIMTCILCSTLIMAL
jgi:voltage-gated cation channel